MKYKETFDGQTVSTIAAMLFLAVAWEFERPAAYKIATTLPKPWSKLLRRRIASRWLQLRRSAGIRSVGIADRPLCEIKENICSLSLALTIEARDLQYLIRIATAVKLEFTGNWGEFLMVTPGAIEYFEVDDAFLDNFIHQMQTLLNRL